MDCCDFGTYECSIAVTTADGTPVAVDRCIADIASFEEVDE